MSITDAILVLLGIVIYFDIIYGILITHKEINTHISISTFYILSITVLRLTNTIKFNSKQFFIYVTMGIIISLLIHFVRFIMDKISYIKYEMKRKEKRKRKVR